MTRLRPSEIRYVQDSINNVFDKRSNHSNVYIGETLDKLCEGRTTVDCIPKIAVYCRDGKYWSADNRRLWVFQQYERLGGCKDIPVLLYHHWGIPYGKFTTNNEGKTVTVRRTPGGSWYYKTDNALIKPTVPRFEPNNNNPSSQFNSNIAGQASFLRSDLLERRREERRREVENIVPSRPLGPNLLTSFPRQPPTRVANSLQRPTDVRRNLNDTSPPTLYFHGLDVPLQTVPRETTHSPGLQPATYGQPSYNSSINSLRNFESLKLQQNASYLDPNKVKYTKKTIPFRSSGIHSGKSLKDLALELAYSQTDVPPIIVYRVFDDDWVVDGNRRLWAYREAAKLRRNLMVPAVIKTDEEEYKTKIRENNQTTLSLKDILLYDGDDIKVTKVDGTSKTCLDDGEPRRRYLSAIM